MKLLILVPLALLALASDHPAPLENRDWKLQELNGQQLPAGLRLIPELRFAKGQVTGNSGCNRLFASYEAAGGALKFGMFGVTRMACAPPQVEEPVLKALGQVTRYQCSGRRLDLLTKDGKVGLRFVAK